MEINNLDTKILESYKMKLFNELIKLVWEEKFDDIEEIPKKVLGEDIYDKFSKDVILNLIRITMGLEPTDDIDMNIKDIIYESINMNEINQPIISIISQACKYCNKESEEKECFVKSKHINCNENNKCSSCGECISKCELGAILDKIQFMPMVKLLKDESCPVYAIMAPAFVGQFGDQATPGKIRTALKVIGFEDMIEVAVAADLLTAIEAFEYHNHIKENKEGYFVTSCCCPVWVSLIQNKFPQVLENMSPSVSPMVACARAIKFLDNNAKVVFVGPCTAKKKEATLEDLKGAVDFVLTFKELEEIFNALKVNPSEQIEEIRTESSFSGRIYAKTGGVSEAIEKTARKIDQNIIFKSEAFNGIKACGEGLEKLINKEIDATFIEGMGCIGGCVGGPKRILPVDKATKCVEEYGAQTKMTTPFENINVAQFLTAMGIKKIDSLSKNEEEEILKIFSRDISINK